MCRVLESQLPELAACAEEVTLKHLLWTSLESWGQVTQELSSTEFSRLDAENLEAVVGQYARTALKIEKGLSPNQVPLLNSMTCCVCKSCPEDLTGVNQQNMMLNGNLSHDHNQKLMNSSTNQSINSGKSSPFQPFSLKQSTHQNQPISPPNYQSLHQLSLVLNLFQN